MELSSNVFWHQTDFNGLKGIIRDKGLFYSYSREDYRSYFGRHMGFPMISLCDLPLSQFDEYIDKYGGYCIGLSHEWGVENGFNPVWYNFMSTEGALFEILKNKTINVVVGYYYLLSSIKPYEGTLYRKEKQYENYRFYDEREIRRVPSLENMNAQNLNPILIGEEYDDFKAERKSHGKKPYLEELGKIDIGYKDIKFLIVKEEYQIEKFYQAINSSYSKEVEDNANSKRKHYIPILTYKQIKEDIIGCAHNVLADLVMDAVLGRNFEGQLFAISNSMKK